LDKKQFPQPEPRLFGIIQILQGGFDAASGRFRHMNLEGIGFVRLTMAAGYFAKE
jgi:hypothetical protein